MLIDKLKRVGHFQPASPLFWTRKKIERKAGVKLQRKVLGGRKPNPELAAIQGNKVVYKKNLAGEDVVSFPITGFGDAVSIEPFVAVPVAPGKEFLRTSSYRYYSMERGKGAVETLSQAPSLN